MNDNHNKDIGNSRSVSSVGGLIDNKLVLTRANTCTYVQHDMSVVIDLECVIRIKSVHKLSICYRKEESNISMTFT